MIMVVAVLLTPAAQSAARADNFKEQMNKVSQQICSTARDKGGGSVAVADFVDHHGNESEPGRNAAAEVRDGVARCSDLRVLDRQLTMKVIDEVAAGNPGEIPSSAARTIGSFLGAGLICTGTVVESSSAVRMDVRVVDTLTGELAAVLPVDIERGDIPGTDKPVKAAPGNAGKRAGHGNRSEFIVNGNFSKGDSNWTRYLGDMTTGYSRARITTFAPATSGKALHISHRGEGFIQYHQMASVPGPDLTFTVSFKTESHEGAIRGFSGSGVVQIALQYFDDDGERLGETVILNYVKNPFADTPLFGVPRRQDDSYRTHFIEVSQGRLYRKYSLNIRREIAENLLGIDPDDVRRIAVVLWCGATHRQASSELWVTDLSLRAAKEK